MQARKAIFQSAKAVSFTTVLAFSIGTYAADSNGWLGGLFGLSVPNADNTTSRTIYGITGGAKVGSELGVGAYYLTSQKDEGGTRGKFDFDLYGVEAAYHFEGEAKGAYVGGRLGTSKLKAGTGATQVSTSPVHWGAVGGYNHFLNDRFTLGGEVSFISVGESKATPTGGSEVTISSFTTLNFLASVKFWF